MHAANANGVRKRKNILLMRVDNAVLVVDTEKACCILGVFVC